MRSRVWLAWGVAALLGVSAATAARAEDIEKKLRFGVSLGAFLPKDSVHSPSGNFRTLLNPDGTTFDFIQDPRNDAGAISDFAVRTQSSIDLSVSYAITPLWYIEGSAGYRRGDVGNVEVQAQFDRTPSSSTQAFQFRIFNLQAGTVQEIPIQFTTGIRFRPKTGFNPYLCAGVGYSFNSFQPSDDLNTLSLNMDRSVGGFSQLVGTAFTGYGFLAPTSFSDLTGIKVDIPDAPEFHAGGGFEVSFKKHWVVFFDARYMVYSGRFKIRINGGDELGISVPPDTKKINEAGAFGPFGAVRVPTGGLIDGGSLVPAVDAPPGTDCNVTPIACEFTGPKDGKPDPGLYYVHAGDVRLDGFTILAGVKFTF